MYVKINTVSYRLLSRVYTNDWYAQRKVCSRSLRCRRWIKRPCAARMSVSIAKLTNALKIACLLDTFHSTSTYEIDLHYISCLLATFDDYSRSRESNCRCTQTYNRRWNEFALSHCLSFHRCDQFEFRSFLFFFTSFGVDLHPLKFCSAILAMPRTLEPSIIVAVQVKLKSYPTKILVRLVMVMAEVEK